MYTLSKSKGSESLKNIWIKRAVRFWVIILLPISAYSGFLAYESHTNIINWQDLSRVSKGRLEAKFIKNDKLEKPLTNELFTDELNAITVSYALIDKAAIQAAIHNKSRNLFLSISISLLLLPLLLGIVYFASSWIWHGFRVKFK